MSHNIFSKNGNKTLDKLLITQISNRVLTALPAAGWSVFIEDDYADQKDYLCTRDDGIPEGT